MKVKTVPIKAEEKNKSLTAAKKAEKKVEVIAKSEPENIATVTPEAAAEPEKTEPVVAVQANTEPVEADLASDAEKVAEEEPAESDSVASLVSGDNNTEVSLAELAGECSNYTQIGYNYYAESIKGASFTGNATITKLAKTNQASRQVNLINDKFGVVVVITLKNVPKQIVANIGIGDDMSLVATVEHSQIIGSSCAVDLSYRITES